MLKRFQIFGFFRGYIIIVIYNQCNDTKIYYLYLYRKITANYAC